MNKQKSFTLIELLVVIVIIGILASVIIVSVSSSINKANFAKAQSFSNTVQNELLGDLVSEWTFDIASNPGEDTWGNNDGTVYGATYKTKASGECVYGGCYSFDGTDDYVEVSGNTAFDVNTITVGGWLKTSIDNNDHHPIILRNTFVSGTGNGFSVTRCRNGLSAGNKLRIMVVGDSSVGYLSSNNLINEDIWHHFILTADGTQIKLYIDGFLNAVSSQPAGNIYQAGSSIYIGTNTSKDIFFNGYIDDVRIYNGALSSAQIKQQYVAGLDSLYSKGIISESEFNDRISGK